MAKTDPTPTEQTDPYAGFSSHLERDTTHFQNLRPHGSRQVETIDRTAPAELVTVAQALLRAHDYQCEITGVWDRDTQLAVARAQQDFALPETGTVGKRMLTKLITELVTK